jgi:hypothetical protein
VCVTFANRVTHVFMGEKNVVISPFVFKHFMTIHFPEMEKVKKSKKRARFIQYS